MTYSLIFTLLISVNIYHVCSVKSEALGHMCAFHEKCSQNSHQTRRVSVVKVLKLPSFIMVGGWGQAAAGFCFPAVSISARWGPPADPLRILHNQSSYVYETPQKLAPGRFSEDCTCVMTVNPRPGPLRAESLPPEPSWTFPPPASPRAAEFMNTRFFSLTRSLQRSPAELQAAAWCVKGSLLVGRVPGRHLHADAQKGSEEQRAVLSESRARLIVARIRLAWQCALLRWRWREIGSWL